MEQINLKNLSSAWDVLCDLVIRPQRNIYDPENALGVKLFTLTNKIYERKDIELKNERGLKIVCSHFQPVDTQRVSEKLPCVVYCHGNCGSRGDALNAVQLLLPYNITVFAFDFTGSGLSEGKHVSLGYYEKDDVKEVVKYLRSTGTVSRIGLWGRSMGAATSLMYSSLDPSISGVVADSPFTSLEDIIVDLVQSHKSWIPKSAIKVATNAMRKTIQSKANFDITKLVPLDYVKNSFIPALFAHAEGDNFIQIKHSQKLYEAYGGDKNFIQFDGDHNSSRPDFFFDSVAIFFYNCLISNDRQIDKEENKPKEDLISRTIGIGKQTKKGKNLKENSEMIKNEEDIDFTEFGEDVTETELDQIKNAMIESLKDQMSQSKDEKEIEELSQRIKEMNNDNFKFVM